MHFRSVFRFLLVASSAAANLLQNGNFESGSWAPWQPASGSGVTVVTPGYHSAHAGALTASSSSVLYTVMYPTVNVTQGKQYSWSLDYKLLNPDCFSLFGINEGILMQLGTTEHQATPGQWSHHEASFVTTGSQESLSISIFCSANTSSSAISAEFDNLVVEAVSDTIYSMQSPATGPNLVKQPNFESGTLNAYQVMYTNTSNATIISPGFQKAKYAVQVNTSISPETVGPVWISQVLRGAKTNHVYQVSAVFRLSPSGPSGTCFMESYAYNPGYPDFNDYFPHINLFTVNYQVPASTEYTIYSAIVAALPGDFAIGFDYNCFQIGLNPQVAVFDMDNIQVVPIS